MPTLRWPCLVLALSCAVAGCGETKDKEPSENSVPNAENCPANDGVTRSCDSNADCEGEASCTACGQCELLSDRYAECPSNNALAGPDCLQDSECGAREVCTACRCTPDPASCTADQIALNYQELTDTPDPGGSGRVCVSRIGEDCDLTTTTACECYAEIVAAEASGVWDTYCEGAGVGCNEGNDGAIVNLECVVAGG